MAVREILARSRHQGLPVLHDEGVVGNPANGFEAETFQGFDPQDCPLRQVPKMIRLVQPVLLDVLSSHLALEL